MKINKQNIEKYIIWLLFFLLMFLIYFGLCKLFGVNIFSDLDYDDDGGRFPKNGSFFGSVSFIASYLIVSKSVKAIVNLKSKKQQDEFLNEFYNFKQRYYQHLSKTPYLYSIIDETQKELIDSYKWLVNITDFCEIHNYKKSTYEIIRQRLLKSIYSYGRHQDKTRNAIIDLYREIVKDRTIFTENDSIIYLKEIEEIIK